MTPPREDELLAILERDYRPEGTTFDVEMRPEDILLMRQLAAKWDTHPINVLGRALELANELADVARTPGHKVLIQHHRRSRFPLPWRRAFCTEVEAFRWRGPENP